MRAANQRTFPELEHAITRFLEDFQSIIYEQVQRAIKKTLGSRKRAAPATVKRPSKNSRTPKKKKAARSRPSAGRKPEQLSLF